ncbi:50S ribosomal protein L25 [Anaerovorax odorimutans]|uniref:50S ribosomal protein L25 n=1 Tax=Anaerovorax odorimutans TaxID=109327 RepID=UPI00042461A3|nr:50S ribosomal protein L25 [Anaerovorax odorimutans]
MNETAIINIEERDHTNSRANRRLRKEGYLPGNIYGKGIEPISIKVDKSELRKKINNYGRHAIFKLDLSGKETFTVIIKEIQNTLMDGDFHVDFQQVSLSEEIRSNVAIKIVGKESIESKKLILVHEMDTISVKGLPQNIPDTIDIDVSHLDLGSVVTIADIKFPEGIVCENDPEHVVVTINESKIKVTDETSDKNEETNNPEISSENI